MSPGPTAPPRVARRRGYLGGGFVVEHRPAGARSGPAVVILPPLGYEDTCAYRPLRLLADTLAEAGATVLRLDWPGLGDSAGDDATPDLVAAWLAAAKAAADALRASGATHVVGIGLRAGAILAAGAAAFDDLVLWAPPLTGKAFLREERAFHRMAEKYFGEPDGGVPAAPAGSVEAGGFLYRAETVGALERLALPELVAAHRPGRALVLPRDGSEAPAKLLDALRLAGTAVELGPGGGVADLLENPYQSKLADAARDAILAFCFAAPATQATPEGDGAPVGPVALADRLDLDGVVERPWVAAGGGGELSGVVCEPAAGAAPGAEWTVFFNAGGIRRAGPNRLWTTTARALARAGRPSVRFDVHDVGDSDGATLPHQDLDEMYSQASVDDAIVAVDQARAWGAGEVDVVGLCSGAFFGMQVSAQRPIRAATLVNGPAYVWNAEARAAGATNQIARSLLDGRRWKRLLTGRIDARAVARSTLVEARLTAARTLARARGAEPPDEVAALIRRVDARGTRLHFVCSAGDPSVAYLDAHLPPEVGARRTVLAGVDHTVRPVWAHPRLVELLVAR